MATRKPADDKPAKKTKAGAKASSTEAKATKKSAAQSKTKEAATKKTKEPTTKKATETTKKATAKTSKKVTSKTSERMDEVFEHEAFTVALENAFNTGVVDVGKMGGGFCGACKKKHAKQFFDVPAKEESFYFCLVSADLLAVYRSKENTYSNYTLDEMAKRLSPKAGFFASLFGASKSVAAVVRKNTKVRLKLVPPFVSATAIVMGVEVDLF